MRAPIFNALPAACSDGVRLQKDEYIARTLREEASRHVLIDEGLHGIVLQKLRARVDAGHARNFGAGFLGLNFSAGFPITVTLAHAAFGLVLGWLLLRIVGPVDSPAWSALRNSADAEHIAG